MPTLDDEDLIRREQESHFRAKRMVYFVAPAGLLLGLASSLIYLSAAMGYVRMDPRNILEIEAPVFLAFLALVVFLGRRNHPPKEALSGRLRRKRPDEMQRRFLWTMLFPMAVIIPANVYSAVASTRSITAEFIAVSALGVILGFYVAAMAFGPFWSRKMMRAVNDELTNANRARAIKQSYPLVMAVFFAVYMACAYQPRWVLQIMPFALVFDVATPIVLFVLAERRAEHGE